MRVVEVFCVGEGLCFWNEKKMKETKRGEKEGDIDDGICRRFSPYATRSPNPTTHPTSSWASTRTRRRWVQSTNFRKD